MVLISKDGHYIFDTCPTRPVPEKFLLKAERELNETPENKAFAINQLREFVLSEKELSCRTNDAFLMMFLRARKYNPARAFALLKKFCGFKRRNPDLFSGMDYDALARIARDRILAFLPYRDADGCALIAVHADKWNPAELDFSHIRRAIALYLYNSIEDPMTQINGYKLIIDVNSHPLKHLRYVTPSNLYLLYNGAQECFPGRFKGIHVVNMSITFKAAWTILCPFISEKIKKRVFFHKSNQALADYFHESIIPVDFDGLLKDVDTCSWLKTALQPENIAILTNC